MVKKNFQSLNHMMKNSTEKISELTNISRCLLDKNKEKLKNIVDLKVSINEDSVYETTEAIDIEKKEK